MADSSELLKIPSVPVELAVPVGGLTPGAKDYFEHSVKEYADKLLNESIGIEEMEHAGAGPAEITAAHVEEAKWVMVRRLRRRKSKRTMLLRVGQLVMSALVGIGASNFVHIWGSLMCVLGLLFGFLLLFAEREWEKNI